jgi:hypothetical protein
MDGYVYNSFEIGEHFRDALEEINERIGFPERTEFIDVEIYVNGKLFQRTFSKGFKGYSLVKNNKEMNYFHLMDVDKDEEGEYEYSNMQDIYYNNIGLKPDFIHLLIDEDLEDINEKIFGVNFYFKT